MSVSTQRFIHDEIAGTPIASAALFRVDNCLNSGMLPMNTPSDKRAQKRSQLTAALVAASLALAGTCATFACAQAQNANSSSHAQGASPTAAPPPVIESAPATSPTFNPPAASTTVQQSPETPVSPNLPSSQLR